MENHRSSLTDHLIEPPVSLLHSPRPLLPAISSVSKKSRLVYEFNYLVKLKLLNAAKTLI